MPAKPAETKTFVAPKVRVDWDKDAACRSADPSLFFIDRDEDDDDSDETGAERYLKAITHYCHRCPVRVECLTTTLAAEPAADHRQGRHGVAGGLTPTQRAEPGLRAIALSGRVPPLPDVKASTGKRRRKRQQQAERPTSKPCGHCGKPVPPAAARRPDVTWWHTTPECRKGAKRAADAERSARRAQVAASRQAA